MKIKWITKDGFTGSYKLYKDGIVRGRSSAGVNFPIKEKELADFLAVQRFADPFLVRNMEKAVNKIDLSIKSGETITIYGNYTLEGIVGTAMLVRAFRKLGIEVNYYIDDSSHQQGISRDSIDYINSLATSLIITVDAGLGSPNEIHYANVKGMDTVVIDNHMGELSHEHNIVLSTGKNGCPYPFKGLSGCGVVFKLIQGLWRYYGLSGCEEMLDIALIGILSQDIDSSGENEAILEEGKKRFNRSEKCGIQALKKLCAIGERVTIKQVQFQILPVIDAITRNFDPRIVVELFTTNDYDKATQIVKYLLNVSKNCFSSKERERVFV